MNQTLKDNFVVLSGIALPILVAIVFFAVTKISTMGIEPPKYRVLYAAGVGEPNRISDNWDLDVKDGKPELVYTGKNPEGFRFSPSFYIFNPKDKTVLQYKPPAIQESAKGQRQTFALTGFGDIKISTDQTSPDGFVFTRPDYRSGGLFTDIFSGGRRYEYVLKKGNYAMSVPNSDRPYDTNFIGWVIE